MKKRIISTVALWACIILVLVLGGHTGGLLLLLLISGLTQWELYQMLEKTGLQPNKQLGVILGTLSLVGCYYISPESPIDIFVIAVVLLTVTILSVTDFTRVTLPTLFGLIYIPFMFQFFGLVLHAYGTLLLPVWIIAVAKFSDVGGLLIGSRLGRNKLAPSISPGKTVEGAAGGILVSVLVGTLLYAIFSSHFPGGFTLFKAALIAGCLGVVAILSDLIESAIKRRAGVKDSGQLVPGIGGAFDLSDSLILAAPAGYLLFKYLL